ncbi:MAG TPA: D-alanyl-D-alanine endopeptidase [Steroidobacteraceae bacterium]|jgi:D-alanyl-D-alanine endopeptidase (penicillin-binding protein 7)
MNHHGRGAWLLALVCLLVAGAAVAQNQGQPLRVKLDRTAAKEPALRSSAALVLDATGSSVLYARHSDVAMPIASITKLMTAIVVTEAGQPLDEMLDVSAEDVSHGRGAISRLTPGARLSRGDLMHLALMASENRAAHVVGRNYPGGIEACVAAMNAKARELGMTNAHFVEPTGLSDGNVASAEDLSKLVMAAAKVPAIREYSTDTSYAVRVGRRMLTFRSTDSLTSKSDWDIVVQKTGYIARAGRCLVMQTVIDARTVVIVLLNSYGKRTRVADARRIRRWMESSEHVHGESQPATPAESATAAPATT